MNRKDARKKVQTRDTVKRGDRISFLKAQRKDKKHKTAKAVQKV